RNRITHRQPRRVRWSQLPRYPGAENNMGQIQDAFTIAGGIVEAAIAGGQIQGTASGAPAAAPSAAPDAPIGSTVGQAPGDTQAPGTVTLPAIATLTVKGI